MFKYLSVALLLAVVSSFTSAETVPPAEFAKPYNYHSAKISPDGTKLAVAIASKGKRRLAVFDMATFQEYVYIIKTKYRKNYLI